MIDVEKMAREAGGVCMIPAREDINPAEWVMTTSDLERFAQAVARRCAEIVYDETSNMHDERDFAIKELIASAIRKEFSIGGK